MKLFVVTHITTLEKKRQVFLEEFERLTSETSRGSYDPIAKAKATTKKKKTNLAGSVKKAKQAGALSQEKLSNQFVSRAFLVKTNLTDIFHKYVDIFIKFNTRGNKIFAKASNGKTYCLHYKTTGVK